MPGVSLARAAAQVRAVTAVRTRALPFSGYAMAALVACAAASAVEAAGLSDGERAELASLLAAKADAAMAGAVDQPVLGVIVELDDPEGRRAPAAELYPPAERQAVLNQRAGRLRGAKQALLERFAPREVEVLREYSHLPMLFARVGGDGGLLALLRRAEVRAVYADRRFTTSLVESLPLVRQPLVTQLGATGAGRTVVIADTGVDYTRSAFGPCTAPGVPAACRVVAALDLASPDGALDADGHGTNVAGVAAAVASGAGIAALDVFDGQYAYSSLVIDAINWAIANQATYGISAVNLSLGDGDRYTAPCTTSAFTTPVANARAAGILVVAAAGNEGFTDGLASPACTPGVVSVGAVYDANLGARSWSGCTDSSTAADQVTCFSNSAGFLSLLAPGALITAAGATYGGTSQAAPHVAAATAVLRAAYPNETASATEARLADGMSVTDPRNGLVRPRLDLLDALGALNDSFAAPLALAGATGTQSVDTTDASAEVGEPDHAGQPATRSVWWTFTAAETGTLTLDTHGSSFDTVLAVYVGSALSGLTGVAANDNDGSPDGASGVTVPVAAGVTYRIAVDGAGGVGGTARLKLGFAPAPPNEVVPLLPPGAFLALAALLALLGARRL